MSKRVFPSAAPISGVAAQCRDMGALCRYIRGVPICAPRRVKTWLSREGGSCLNTSTRHETWWTFLNSRSCPMQSRPVSRHAHVTRHARVSQYRGQSQDMAVHVSIHGLWTKTCVGCLNTYRASRHGGRVSRHVWACQDTSVLTRPPFCLDTNVCLGTRQPLS